nr:hypothetical protein [Tanacetum cinerariifolium]
MIKGIGTVAALITDYSRPSPTVESTSRDDQNRNPSVSETVASPITSKPFIKFVKPKYSQLKSKTSKTESPTKPPVKYDEQYRKPNKKPNVRGNQKNWNNLKSYQLGPDFVMKKKACFNCGDFNHLAYDCRKRVKKSFTPKPVVHRPYRPSQRPVRTNMNGARPNRTFFNKQAHSYANRPFHRTSAVRSHYRAPWVLTVNRSFPPVNRKLSTGSRNFPSTNRKFPTASRKFPTGSTKCSTTDMGMKGKAVKPSACWFWKPSQNLYNKGLNNNSVSVMFKKYTYIDTQGRLKDFKLLDDANILLRTPRQHSIDLNNIVPHRDLTCLVAKASADEYESMSWHKRLGHLNFKTMNRLARHNLVRGLPSKSFDNDHTCAACLKGKQHKASCKTKFVNSMTKPLHTLHMDLFGPTSISSLNHKWYCLVVTDNFSRFTWTFFLKTKDETSGILRNFLTEIENLKELRVKIIRCDNGDEFKNKEMNNFCSKKGIKREFSNARTPQQNSVAERRNRTLIEAARTMLADVRLPVTFWAKAVNTAWKFEVKEDECYFIRYSMSSKAFRVFNKRTKRVEENLHVDFLENKPIKKGVGPNWLFDINSLTNSMNYVTVVVAGTNSTNFLGTKEAAGQDVKKDVSSLRYIVLPNCGNSNPTATSTNPLADHMETLAVETPIPTVSSLVSTACLNDSPEPSSDTRLISKRVTSQDDTSSLDNILSLTNRFEDILRVTTNTDDTNGVEADLCNMEITITASPTPTLKIHKDHPKIYQMDVKSAFFYDTINEEVYVMQPPGFQDPEFPARLYKVEKAMYGLHQAPRAWIETMEEGTKILATVDGKLRTVSESSIRRNLKLNDEAGINSLPNAELFENLQLMGYNILPNQKFTFQKGVKAQEHQLSPITHPLLRQHHHHKLSSSSLPPVTTESFPTVIPSDNPPLRQYTRRTRIAQSLVLPPDRANIAKTSTLPSDSTPRVTSLAADKDSMQQKLDELTALCTSLQRQQSEMISKFALQELEINRLKALIKLLEDKDRGVAEQSSDDAPIKGRRLDEGEEAAKRVSDDTKEMATILTSMDAASILTSGGVQVVPTAAEVATATVSISTGSGVVSTASPTIPTAALIFTTATESTPYTRRKGKETMVESETPKRNKEYHQLAAELPIKRIIELISDLVKYQDKYAKVLKYQTQQRKPLTRKQQREFYTSIQYFIPIGSKEEAERFKRKGLRLEQENVKKLKTSEEVKATEEVLEEKVKEMMQLVLLKKYMEDLNQIWALVKETLNIRPATSNKGMELWVELKRLYEPDVEDQLWTHTQNLMHAPVEWKMYDTCGVHHVTSKDKEIFMLVEKDHPLRKGLAIVMISYKLQVENYFQMAK